VPIATSWMSSGGFESRIRTGQTTQNEEHRRRL
jgi:hypothetical protein